MQNWEKHMDRHEFFLVYIVSTIVFVYHFFIGSIMNEDCKNGLIFDNLTFQNEEYTERKKVLWKLIIACKDNNCWCLQNALPEKRPFYS